MSSLPTHEKPEQASPAELRSVAGRLDQLTPDDTEELSQIAERLWVLNFPWYKLTYRNADPVAHVVKFIKRIKTPGDEARPGITRRRLDGLARALREYAALVEKTSA